MRQGRRGTTLVETLVVLVILSILFAISSATYFHAYGHVRRKLISSGAVSEQPGGQLQWQPAGKAWYQPDHLP